MSNTKIGKILTRLLSDQNMRVSELARKIQLPQPTIQRIAAGVCENPHLSSLKPIADFFSITIDQLKGLEPIPKFDKIFKLPLITWSEAAHWNKQLTTNTNEHVITDINASYHAYALRILDGAMEPIFPLDAVLMVDPTVSPKDRSYVITLMDGSIIPIFRQLIINGADRYLKPLSPDTDIYKMAQIGNLDNILATVIQARWNYSG
jgi:SOS-response transcriptional repressor LexA